MLYNSGIELYAQTFKTHTFRAELTILIMLSLSKMNFFNWLANSRHCLASYTPQTLRVMTSCILFI